MPATQLRHLRIDLGLTQREVWEPAQVSAGRFSLIERGVVEPTPGERERIAAIIRVRPEELFQSRQLELPFGETEAALGNSSGETN